MLIKTEANEGTIGNVRYMEGVVALNKVKLNVYCYEVDGMLIDTGAPRLLSDFKPFFDKVRADKVVLTHSHEDHVGGAAYIKHKYNLPIYMDRIGIEDSTKKANYPFYRKVFWGKREPFQALPLEKTIESRNATWDVIQTPGHAPDHVSLLNRKTGQLFTGDLFVQPQTKIILKDESIPTIISSIRRVLGYDFEELYCCHAGHVKSGRSVLQSKLDYLLELQEKIRELSRKGYSEKEIQKQLFNGRYSISYISFGEWDSIHIIRSVLRETS